MHLEVIFLVALCIRMVLGKQPNIVFILADDYGWNDIGYHDSNIKTPTLDKLAAGGIKLESHYVQPVCTPTRSALLSGRMPIHTGMHRKLRTTEPLCHPLQDKFLPEKLRELGYATHMVGKWHIGFYKEQCTPVHRGFDTFFGFFSGEETYFTHLREGYLDFSSQTSSTQLKAETNYTGIYSTHIFAEKAQDIIAKHKRATPNKPLFLYLPFQAVHLPNEVPIQYENKYRHFLDTPRRKYAGMVSCMDEAIRNVTHALRKHEMWDSTLIVFSSDNGGECNWGSSNWPLRGFKGTTFEGGIRVNAFVYSPLLNQSNVINRDLFHITDWFPTLVHAAGGRTDGMDIDGINQWDVLRKREPSRRQEILHDVDITLPLYGSAGFSHIFDTRIRAALRVGDWKLLTGIGSSRWHVRPVANRLGPRRREADRGTEKNIWLFNITEDPCEEHDLSHVHADVVTRMLLKLRNYKLSTANKQWPEKEEKSSPRFHDGEFWKPWEQDEPINTTNGLYNETHNSHILRTRQVIAKRIRNVEYFEQALDNITSFALENRMALYKKEKGRIPVVIVHMLSIIFVAAAFLSIIIIRGLKRVLTIFTSPVYSQDRS